MMLSARIFQQGEPMRLLLRCSTVPIRSIHCSAIDYSKNRRPDFIGTLIKTFYYKRRGPVTNPNLPELIIDKPPGYYPNLQQKLDRINYYDSSLNEVNIGYAKDSECFNNFVKCSNEIVSNMKLGDINEDEDLEFDDAVKSVSLEADQYERLSKLNAFTQEHLFSTKDLANHFAIYRDLFFIEPVKPSNYRDSIVANAKNEQKFSVGSLPPTFSFLPLVPIEAEFHTESGPDEVLCQKSHRGNLIPPEFGSKPPTIVINSAAINGSSEVEESAEKSPIVLSSGKTSDPSFYTLALVNLDSHFNDSGVCHWMLANIHKSNNATTYESVVKYLPIYGIQGLGYHRYTFVLFKHDKPLTNLDKVDDFDLSKRKFNGLEFIKKYSSQDIDMTPVGLSWFQTTWDENCSDVFYNYLNIRSPSYEYIYPKQSSEFEQLQFPARAPFNLYLDQFRDPKEMSKEVLLERLKSINPLKSYDTSKMYPTWKGEPMLPHIHAVPHLEKVQDWRRSTLLRMRDRTGRFRGLRPASAILPLNNNADLDKPKWPRVSPEFWPINCPNPYPDGKRRPIPMRLTEWAKPLNEHHSTRVDYVETLNADDTASFKNEPKS